MSGRLARWCGYLLMGALFGLLVTYGPSSKPDPSLADAALLAVSFAVFYALVGVAAQSWRRRLRGRSARTSRPA